MIRWIIKSSMKLQLVMAAVAVMLLIIGFTMVNELPVDALPEFSRPYVEIQTEALGLSAQEVEAMITTPMEADMLNGTTWVQEIRSISLPGLSTIVLVFEPGTDIMRARQVVQERLTEVFALPNVSKPPTMINPVSSASRLMEIGLTSEKLSLIEMSVLARWTIAPRLMGLPGVANVAIWGERQRQLQVQVNPEKLRAQGVTLTQIIKTTGNSLWASPLSFLEASTPGTGGWIETPNQRLGIRHILPIKTASELAQVPIEGAPSKRLGDVTTVLEDHQPLIGDAIIKDAPSLMLVVEKFPWANTKEVTQDVEEALDALRPGLASMQMDPTLFRPATFIEKSVHNLALVLIMGLILLIAALFVFLFNWRTAIIAIVSILTSMIIAGLVFYLAGTTINMMIIAGLMIALAVVIDNAIIDIDNISRRFREEQKQDEKKSIASVIFETVAGMQSTIFYATVILVLAVMPILFLKGVAGAFFRPVAVSFIFALLASMLVALTITPALCLILLKKNGSSQTGESPIARILKGIYSASFGWVSRTPRIAFTALCVGAVVAVLCIPFLHQESLLPDFKETDLVINFEGSASASHPAMSRIMTRASQELRKIPGVRNVSGHVGRAIMSDKQTNINAGQLWVSLDPNSDYSKAVSDVKEIVAGYPGLSPEVLTYLQSKVREELSGTGRSLVIRVYGEDMNIIRQKAEECQGMLSGIDGVTGAYVEYPDEMPTMEIEVNIENAKSYGLKPGDVRRAATSLVSGLVVGSLFEEQKVFDVVVWGAPEVRQSITSVQNLLINTPGGGHVRLKDVADVRIVPTVTAINRDAVARCIDVVANVHGRDISAMAADIQDGIQRITFPLEYRAELLGEYAETLAARKRMRAFAIAAAIGIFLILQAAFRSWSLALFVFLTLPMATIGGLLTELFTTGGILSFGSLIGFITIYGIAIRNGIVLIRRYQQLELYEGKSFGPETVRQATVERAVPVLMAAVTSALVLLPFSLFGDIAGLAILHPMANVIIGGLITTTLFTLMGVPAVYLLFGASREPELNLNPDIAVAQ